jgi:ligand-binding sensor domain-containing protein
VLKIVELRGGTYALTPEGLFDVRTWERVIAPDHAPLADGNIAALAAEPSGRVWVGYFDRGLDVIEPGGERVKHLEDEHLFCVNRIVQTPDHGGWAVATANGLVLIDSHANKRHVIGREQGLIANHVTDVALLADSLVVATPAGVTFVGKDGPRSLYAFHGLVSNHVYALGASGGRLVAGTLGGLSVLEGGFVRANYTTANSSLRHNWVSAVVGVDRDWMVGTYGSGVYRLDSTGAWHTFPDMPSGVEVNPNAMASTSDRVYAGTLSSGLLVFDKAGNRWHTFAGRLPSQNVTALAAQGGWLYVGTDNGLVRVKESEL